MSNKSERMYYIQQFILPSIYPSLEKNKIFNKSYSTNQIFNFLDNSLHRTSLRTVRRDLECLMASSRIHKSSINNHSKYYVPAESKHGTIIGNLPRQRTLVASNHDLSIINNISSYKTNFPSSLTDIEVDGRFIEKHGYLSFIPNQDTKDKVNVIKEALKQQSRLLFGYEKHADGEVLVKEINPIGVINDCGNYLIVGTKVGQGIEGERRYKISKMKNIKVLNSVKFFPQISQQQATEILHSGREDYLISSSINNKVHLILKKDAADLFSAGLIDGATDWQFRWLDKKEKIAELTFSCTISVNFLKGLLCFGSAIQIVGPSCLKEALAIQNQVEPHSRKNAMHSLFNLSC
ncbi:WYL domain-containing protein [Colwellia sp. BRX8-9]|uniref:WYL domain-containing protein n=1 Tax=Colwellia sp. BRX8-9 TaxID=2759831 RepID=UPI0015F61206|nr:WYL domain-containing protein [Colwellia sp. BRX8-9]MBA6348117.1 WYL domain-containing protein [Colwellia sp. BRX8-9]